MLSELLDIPVRAINIPKQFVLSYFKTDYDFSRHTENFMYKSEFFIDPISGQVFTHKDVETYFKRISVPPVTSYFQAAQQQKNYTNAAGRIQQVFLSEERR